MTSERAEKIIKGFPHDSRGRGRTVYRLGLYDMAVRLEELLYANAGLNDAELISRIGILIKETKESNS
jgi:hypothetical protein